MARKYKDEINKLLREKQIVESRKIDRKTYCSALGYKLTMENQGDLRYNYALAKMKGWPGGSLEKWINILHPEIDGNVIDYGLGGNKLENQISMSSEMAKEYKMYHTPNLDHYPDPHALGGQKVFSNLRIVNQLANIQRQHLTTDEILPSIKNLLENYGYTYEDLKQYY